MNNLPKSWGVYFEKSPGQNNPVIEYLNGLYVHEYNFGGCCGQVYYGINKEGETYCTTSLVDFDTIITKEQFLIMSKEVESKIYSVIESVDCEVISLRTSTDEAKIIDLFKSLVNEDSDIITDEQIELFIINKVYYGVNNYKVYLLESKII